MATTAHILKSKDAPIMAALGAAAVVGLGSEAFVASKPFAGAGEIFWWPFCVPVNSSQRARCARRGALQARLRSGVQLPFQDRDPLVGRAGREFRSYLKGCVCQPCRAGSSNRDAHDFRQDVGGWRRGRCHCGPWARSFATSPRYCCIPAGAGQESTAQQCEGMMSP